jgi:hypothetical protein
MLELGEPFWKVQSSRISTFIGSVTFLGTTHDASAVLPRGVDGMIARQCWPLLPVNVAVLVPGPPLLKKKALTLHGQSAAATPEIGKQETNRSSSLGVSKAGGAGLAVGLGLGVDLASIPAARNVRNVRTAMTAVRITTTQVKVFSLPAV